jgi:hypothetical protein
MLSADPEPCKKQGSFHSYRSHASSFFIGESITQRPRSTLQLTCYNTVVGGAVGS